MAEEKSPLENTTVDVTVSILLLIVAVALFGVYFETILGWYGAFLEWIYSFGWGRIFTILAVIFALLDLLLIGFIIFTIRQHQKLKKKISAEEKLAVHVVPLDEEARSAWEEIQRLAASQNPSEWNMAIIRADGLFDEALQRLGYEGESMADRLKIIDPAKLPSLERIWSAHRLRNTIVHGALQEHTKETISYALRSYEQGLIELGVLGPQK